MVKKVHAAHILVGGEGKAKELSISAGSGEE